MSRTVVVTGGAKGIGRAVGASDTRASDTLGIALRMARISTAPDSFTRGECARC